MRQVGGGLFQEDKMAKKVKCFSMNIYQKRVSFREAFMLFFVCFFICLFFYVTVKLPLPIDIKHWLCYLECRHYLNSACSFASVVALQCEESVFFFYMEDHTAM